MDSFSRFLDELDAAKRRIEDEQATQAFVKAFWDSDQRAKRASAHLLGRFDSMAKSLEADQVERARAERAEFNTRLGEAIAQANSACEAGLLSADQASRIDLQIGSLQQRAAEISL